MENDQVLNVIKPFLSKMGRPVYTQDGLIVPERTANDIEFQKALRGEIQAYKERRGLQQKVSPIMPWKTTIFSAFEQISDPLGREKRTQPNMSQLHVVSYKCPLVTACIVTQRHKITALDEISHDERKKGWRIVQDNYFDPKYDISKKDEQISKEIEQIILYPDKLRDKHFSMMLPKVLNDHLVFDRVCIEPRFERNLFNKRKKIVGYCHVDGTTIKPLIEPVIAEMKDSFFDQVGVRNTMILNTLSRLEGTSHVDLFERDDKKKIIIDKKTGQPKLKTWVQVVDGQIVGSFSEDQLIVGISNPSPRINRYGYGISLVEEATEGIVAWLTSFNTNKNLQSEGIVDGFLAAIGDIDKEILEGWRDELSSQTKGVHNVGRIPLIGLPDFGGGSKAGLQWINMRPTQKEALYDYWLSFVTNLVVSGIFQIHPSELGMKELGTGGTALSEGSHDGDREMKAVGHISIMKFIKNQVMDELVRMIALNNYGRNDFQFVWNGVSQEMTRTEELEYLSKKYDNVMSLTEVRKEMGMKPIWEEQDFPKDDEMWTQTVQKLSSIPGKWITPVIQLIQNEQMMEAQNQMMGGQEIGQEQGQIEQGEEPKQLQEAEEEDQTFGQKEGQKQPVEKSHTKTTTITITRQV